MKLRLFDTGRDNEILVNVRPSVRSLLIHSKSMSKRQEIFHYPLISPMNRVMK